MIGFITQKNKAEKAFIAIILFGFLFLLIAPLAKADYYAHFFWVISGTKRIITCAIEPNATGYELNIRKIESGKTVYKTVGTKNQWEIIWRTPGHYVAYVRWYKQVDGVTTFSEWKNSLEENSSLVMVDANWQPRPWAIVIPTSY